MAWIASNMFHWANAIFVLLILICSQAAVAQTDFEAVRQQAAKSKSSQKVISVLDAYAEDPTTSVEDRIRSLDYLARFCAHRGNSRLADKYVSEAKPLAESHENRIFIRNLLQVESGVANQRSDFKRGIAAATRCIEVSESIEPNSDYLAKPLNERAINHTCLSQFDEALIDYRRALEIAQATGDERLQLRIIGNIASTYDELKLHQMSIEQYKIALELAERHQERSVIGRITVNLASAYLQLNQYELARANFLEALTIAEAMDNDELIAMVATGLGDLDVIKGRLDEAGQYFEKASAAFKRRSDFVGLLQIQTRLFRLKSLEDKHQESLAEQIKTLQAMLESAELGQQYEISIDVIDQLMEKHKERAEWPTVLELTEKKIDYAEQVWTDSNLAAVLEIETARTELWQKQKDNTRLWITTVVATLLVIVLLCVWRAKHQATTRLELENREIRKNQQDRTILEKQMAERRKLESLSTMSAGLIHDFNNYLMAIVSSAEIGQLFPDSERKNELFETILNTGISASELTRSLSEYLGRGQLSNAFCEIGEATQSQMSVWKEIAGPNVEVTFTPSEQMMWVNIDNAQLNQIVSNIIKNSREAIQGQGRIDIWTETLDAQHFPPRYSKDLGLVSVQDEQYCHLKFRDDGAGMTPEQVAHAIDPYFSTKGIGRGLGLASACGIIESHDGKFVIESEIGVGTETSIVLPLIDIKAERRGEKAADDFHVEPFIDLASTNVLLVEDENAVGQGVRHYLQSHGIHVELVKDVSTALQALETQPFDCVVTDYMLPDQTGHDLAQVVRQQYGDLPIILISAYTAADIFKFELFDLYLAKPFPLHHLLTALRKLIRGSAAPSAVT
ncbi:MAG: signal transduction histidine kinase/ActR/RegA family two-component response regulator [Mariniblastus sp.]|jgi:signal transduction histidine kinase/ActR/RegA family two-component response regulator